MTPAGVGESRVVLVGKRREFLEPALAAAGREYFDDPRWLVSRIPHGVLDVAWLECPLARASGADLVADQDADLPGLDAHPDVIAVHVIRDQDPGRDSLPDHGQDPVGVLRSHLHLDLEGAGERRGRLRDNQVWRWHPATLPGYPNSDISPILVAAGSGAAGVSRFGRVHSSAARSSLPRPAGSAAGAHRRART
jgi:hypothetical protein